MTRALIYLSFLSIPGAESLGLLPLTGLYVLLILATAVVFAITKNNTIPLSSFVYLLSIPALLLANYYIAHLYEVDTMVWLARAVHLGLIPFFYLAFKYSKVSPKVLFLDVCICGLIEVALIYGTFFAYLDTEQLRRASDIEGVIVYTVFLLFGAFHCLARFNKTGQRRYLLLYGLVLLATLLTGSRSLTIATLMVVLALRQKALFLLVVGVVGVITLAFAGNSLIDRYDLTKYEHLITVLSKLEELWILWNMFLENPPLGTGLGNAYQVSIALTRYTYSHNILFFYLGYAGLLGLLVAIYPLLRLFFRPGYRVLVMAVFFFYTSSTTYTNLKHSLLLALILVLLDSVQSNKKQRVIKRTLKAQDNDITSDSEVHAQPGLSSSSVEKARSVN